MSTIDLGDEEFADVKVFGEQYRVRMPSVAEAMAIESRIKKAPDSAVDLYAEIMDELGLPKDVYKRLNGRQMKKLTAGLLEFTEKK